MQKFIASRRAVATFPTLSDTSRVSEAPDRRDAPDLRYALARSLDDVLAGWELVYRAYHASGLIEANEQRIHTLPEAIGPHTAVVVGRHRGTVVSTISGYLDGDRGLPLDSTYPGEIEALRQQGRRLCEVGLFADRREHLGRTADNIFEMMRYSFFYALHSDADDIIVGVHPRHAPFYQRLIGFEVAGPLKQYAVVRDHPVVLLRLDLERALAQPRPPRGLRYFMQNRLPASVFAQRFRFPEPLVARSRLGRFLHRTATPLPLRSAS